MAQMDLNKERQRLTAYYASLDDAELREIASESAELTDVAREVLRSEVSRRAMNPAPEIFGPAVTTEGLPAEAPVMVRRYRDLLEASLAKSILDSAGVESFLVDDNLVRLDWLYSNAVGGVKVLVRAENADTARELLQQAVPESFPFDETDQYEQPRCPKCGSFEITLNGLDKRFYAGMLVGLPIPVAIKGWHCLACQNTWPSEGDEPPKPSSTDGPES